VGEGREGDEYIITRLGHVQPAVNIVNIYGENEKRAGEPRILESWLRLKEDLDGIQGRGEQIVLIGDMNRAVGADRWGIPGNRETVSPGGRLIREQLLQGGEFTLLNSLELVEGGPHTWVQAGKEEVKSCLDLVIVSTALVPFVERVMIDTVY
jgi:hypothetical protein